MFGRHIKRWEFGDSPTGQTSAWVEDLTWDPAEDEWYFHNTMDQTHDIVRRVADGLPPAINPRDAYETTRLQFAAEHAADCGQIVQLADFEPLPPASALDDTEPSKTA